MSTPLTLRKWITLLIEREVRHCTRALAEAQRALDAAIAVNEPPRTRAPKHAQVTSRRRQLDLARKNLILWEQNHDPYRNADRDHAATPRRIPPAARARTS